MRTHVGSANCLLVNSGNSLGRGMNTNVSSNPSSRNVSKTVSILMKAFVFYVMQRYMQSKCGCVVSFGHLEC